MDTSALLTLVGFLTVLVHVVVFTESFQCNTHPGCGHGVCANGVAGDRNESDIYPGVTGGKNI